MAEKLPRYTINENPHAPGAKTITCHICGFTSFYRDDVSRRYCPRYNVFHRDAAALAALEARRAAGPMTLNAALGSVLAVLRGERHLSQAELARRAQVSGTYLGSLEAGKNSPTLELVFRLARALGLTAADLVGRAEKEYHEALLYREELPPR